MKVLVRSLAAVLVALMSLGAISQRAREHGVTETEIRIGNLMPYTGDLAAWTLAPLNISFMQFWIELTGRRMAGPPFNEGQ
jgi:hypothetical protein